LLIACIHKKLWQYLFGEVASMSKKEAV